MHLPEVAQPFRAVKWAHSHACMQERKRRKKKREIERDREKEKEEGSRPGQREQKRKKTESKGQHAQHGPASTRRCCPGGTRREERKENPSRPREKKGGRRRRKRKKKEPDPETAAPDSRKRRKKKKLPDSHRSIHTKNAHPEPMKTQSLQSTELVAQNPPQKTRRNKNRTPKKNLRQGEFLSSPFSGRKKGIFGPKIRAKNPGLPFRSS